MIVDVSRGRAVESTHHVQGVVCSSAGDEELCAGDPEILDADGPWLTEDLR